MMIGITADCTTRLHREYPLLLSPQAQPTPRPLDSRASRPTTPADREAPASASPGGTAHHDVPPLRARNPAPHRTHSQPQDTSALPPSRCLCRSTSDRDKTTCRSGAAKPALPARPCSRDRKDILRRPSAQTDREQELIARVDEKISRLIEMEEKIRQLEALSRRLDAQNQRLQTLLAKPTAAARTTPSRDYLALPWLLLYALALISVERLPLGMEKKARGRLRHGDRTRVCAAR